MLHTADYILLGLVALAVVGALYWMHRLKKSSKGCCGNCQGCNFHCNKK